IVSCTSSEGGEEATISTVDSNTIGTTDTVPAILYLDNPQQDSFPMAMDSVGPTIQPEDTLY
ncbi:MAG TPA: hypothetical protein VD794_03640, partial [Flavisolibacter sp.]|nr:hypothetical protein [Flavisolibacter sp.]